MFCYPVYKLIKEELKNIAPCFFYMGQYQLNNYKPLNNKAMLKVPAIYIETPKLNQLTFFGKRTLVIKPAPFKIHYVSHAPYKQQDNSIQDSALLAHTRALRDINDILEGKALFDAGGNRVTQSFIPISVNELNFLPESVFSVLGYTTEVYRAAI